MALLKLVLTICCMVCYTVMGAQQSDFVTMEMFEELKAALDSKNVIINELVGKVEKLDETVKQQAKTIKNLENAVSQIQHKDEQSSEVKSLNSTTEDTKTKSLVKQSRESTNKLTAVQEHHQDAKGNIETRRVPGSVEGEHIFRKRHSNETLVAFSAYHSKPVENLGVHQNIVFDNVVVNAEGASNVQQGIFVAPVSGTYVFFTTLLSYNGRDFSFQYSVNGIGQVNMLVSGRNVGFDTSSLTVLFHLNQGDDVAIRNETPNGSIDGNNFSTFSGFLLKED